MNQISIQKPTLQQIAIVSRRQAMWNLGMAALLGKTLLASTTEFLETEDNIEGPFYKPGAPERSALIENGMPGTPLEVTGRVFNTRGELLPGAVLDIWQASDQGQYDNSGFTLRGIIHADEKGFYRLRTIVPKHYQTGPNTYRPAHIHLKLRSAGCRELTTQLYFKGDAYNAVDSAVRPSLMLRPKDTPAGKTAKFDFVLRAV